MSSLYSLWRTLEREPVLAAVEKQWRYWLGETIEVARPFLRPERERAAFVPCDDECHESCLRRVVVHGDDDIVAVCDEQNERREAFTPLPPLTLRRDEVVVWRFDLQALAKEISRALGYSGPAGQQIPGVRGVTSLGRVTRAGELEQSPVYLIAPYTSDGIVRLIARSPFPRLSVVTLVSDVLNEADLELLAAHGSSWASCDELLDVRKSAHGQLELQARMRLVAGGGPAPMVVHQEPVPTICRRVGNEGSSELTQGEYRKLVGEAESFDLYLDLTSTIAGGRFRAGRRNEKGRFEEATLTRNQAAALAELVESGRAMRPNELRSLSVNGPAKVIEKARSAVDRRVSRYQWRAFHTLTGDDPAAKRFQFRPPENFRFALVLPL